ncbi:MAG: glutamate 5-kinase [Acidiferrobacteraceae bacterium]|jgi:glutamate 5-kinase
MSSASATDPRAGLLAARRCVIKVGSALLAGGAGLDQDTVAALGSQIATLRQRGVEVVLVTSGSVAAGMHRLGIRQRPHALHELQAMAAVGQMGLVQAYESAFQKHGLHTAQVLLTHDDLADRERYLNARSTLRTLLGHGVIPVINENDTVAVEEIRFGDNDTLAALVVNLLEAELLIILTDQAGLYEQDPRAHPDAKLVSDGSAGDPALARMAGGSGALGRGGMQTKLEAARKAARSGASTIICSGREPEVLSRLFQGEVLGTCLRPTQGRLASRKQWLAGQLKPRGRLILDAGAVEVLRRDGRSLLPVGVTAAEGQFRRGELVACVDPAGVEIARGLVNYDRDDTVRIIGRPSGEIESVLGYVDEPELIHRDNMVLL